MIKVSRKYSKELLLLILFVNTTYSSLVSFLASSKCGDDWTDDQFPPFFPKSNVAKQEYCNIHEKEELSRNDQEYMLEKWAAKYGISDEFEKFLTEKKLYEDVYRKMFLNKIDNILSGELQTILLTIFSLMDNKVDPIERINIKINEILDKLPSGKWIHFLKIWALLDEEVIEETEAYLTLKKKLSIKKNKKNDVQQPVEKPMEKNEENDDLAMLFNPFSK